MAFARDTVVDRILAQLEGAWSPSIGTVTAVVTADTSLTMKTGGDEIRTGDLVELDYEVIRPYRETTANTVFTVHRAQRGTTAAQYSADTIMRIRPRWFRQDILNALVDELRGMPVDLYGVTTTDVSFSADNNTATLGSAGDFTNKKVLGIRAVRRDPITSNERHNTVNLELLRDPQAGSFASGYGVQLASGDWVYNVAVTLRVTYLHTFDLSTVETTNDDLETDLGLSPSMVQAVQFGALWRLQSTRELARARESAVGQNRDDASIPPGYNVDIANNLRAVRDSLYEEERARLVNEWPRYFRRD